MNWLEERFFRLELIATQSCAHLLSFPHVRHKSDSDSQDPDSEAEPDEYSLDESFLFVVYLSNSVADHSIAPRNESNLSRLTLNSPLGQFCFTLPVVTSVT